jgi:DNA-binding transcriptional ArsR family regulator
MDPLEALGDPVRRRIVEQLAEGELQAGALARDAEARFGITQPATSRHLRILRDVGLVSSRVEGKQRVYSLERGAFDEVGAWLDGIRSFWSGRLDALETELVRGRRNAGGTAAAAEIGEEAS